MSYSLHGSTASDLAVQVDTEAAIAATLGADEPFDPDQLSLVLNDPGNQHALVIDGDDADLVDFARRVNAAVEQLIAKRHPVTRPAPSPPPPPWQSAVKPGTAAFCRVTGLYPDDLPITGLDDRDDFRRTDEFNGDGYDHRVTWWGPDGVAVVTISPDGIYTVVDRGTGTTVYQADMRRPA